GQQNLNVNLTGQFTHFQQGATTASFGARITLVSSPANSATTATTVVNIDAATATGNRNVTLTTGLEVVTLTNGFTVAAGTPVLQDRKSGGEGKGGETRGGDVIGQIRHLVEGATDASVGGG